MANDSPDYDRIWLAKPAPITAYLVLNLLVLLAASYGVWTGALAPGGLSAQKLHIFKLVAGTLCLGGLGGNSYSIYGLCKHVSRGDYESSYLYTYLLRGLIGALLGLISFLLLQGGLLTLADQPLSEPLCSSFRSQALVGSVAFLAGFSTNQSVAKLQELARAIFGQQKREK